MSRAQHSSENPNWGTPLWIVDAARKTLGGEIHLDPASSEVANVGVQAEHFFAPPQDGLSLPWHAARVFVNPPGGRGVFRTWQTRSSQVAWWRKAITECLNLKNVEQCVFVAFSLELMQSSQSHGWLGPLDGRFSLCAPRERIKFDLVAADGSRQAGEQPAHANLIVGIGCDPALFERHMSEVGQVLKASRL